MREESTEHARSFFTSLGFTVEDIPEAQDQKRADLRATLNGEEYIVEAKLREPQYEWKAASQRLGEDGFATVSRDILPWATLSQPILKSHAQLSATPARPDAFRILWVVALHDDDNFVISCVKKRLLGTRPLMVLRDFTPPPEPNCCYYYDDNDFEHCPRIDAAALSTRRMTLLLVNNYAPNRDRFRESHLYSEAKANGALIDAEIAARDGKALLLDRDFQGPREGRAQGDYLDGKYGVQVIPMMESAFLGVVVYPSAATDSEDDVVK